MHDPTPTLDQQSGPDHPNPVAIAQRRVLARLAADGPAPVFELAEDMADLTESERVAELLTMRALLALVRSGQVRPEARERWALTGH